MYDLITWQINRSTPWKGRPSRACFPAKYKPTNEQIEQNSAPMIAGASRVRREIKGEINKSRHGRVYMYNTGEQLLGPARTQDRVTHSHTRSNKQADRE